MRRTYRFSTYFFGVPALSVFGKSSNVFKYFVAALLLNRPEVTCMQIRLNALSIRPSRSQRAFNIVEAIIAMAVCGIMFVALYSGISSSFFNIRLARENLRGTQVLLEKMEVIRLLTWDQINSNGFVATNFSAPLFPSLSSSSNSAAFFNGYIDIQPVTGLNANYSGDLRIVTVTIRWKTGGLQQSRRLSTYVSRFGIQNYVYN